ncbi:MAG TPA: hypothetical protein PLR99_28885 [Polyangiaceae bacterium]|nr:hypothetical protein [Polyangiaceae bacterium]
MLPSGPTLHSCGAAALALGLAARLATLTACDGITTTPPESPSTVDSGLYDCAKFAGYKKLCANDPTPSQSPESVCLDHTRHAKCGALGAKAMECLWGLQSRKDLCGADGVTIPGKVSDACGAADANDADCRARNP